MNGTRLNIPGTEIVALVESAIRKPDPEQMNTVRRCVNWFLQQVKPPYAQHHEWNAKKPLNILNRMTLSRPYQPTKVVST